MSLPDGKRLCESYLKLVGGTRVDQRSDLVEAARKYFPHMVAQLVDDIEESAPKHGRSAEAQQKRWRTIGAVTMLLAFIDALPVRRGEHARAPEDEGGEPTAHPTFGYLKPRGTP